MSSAFIQTFTGSKFDFIDIEKNNVSIYDIAHSLSNICRFTGHTKKHYSVAQHCVLASKYASDNNKLVTLLHDATECFIGDMSSPLKSIFPDYCALEDKIYKNLIAKMFNLPDEMPKEVKEIDLKMLVTEKRDLLRKSNIEWSEFFNNIEPYADKIKPWSNKKAEIKFLNTFYKLDFLRNVK
jgi:hypothetical protein